MFKVQKITETKPKELVSGDQPMIMEVIQACQEILDEAADAKAAGLKLPSLEEERASHEATLAKAAEEEKQEDAKKKQLESLEEERMLESLVEDEFKRQKAKSKDMRKKNHASSSTLESNFFSISAEKLDILAFDQPVDLRDADDNIIHCQAFSEKILHRKGPVSSCFTIRPVAVHPTHGMQSIKGAPLLALKEAEVTSVAKEQNSFKTRLQSFETEIEKIRTIRHQNILLFHDFKIQKSKSSTSPAWTVSILTEFADKGSLEELLEMTGSLNVERVRSWTIDLLDALHFLHSKNIIHEDIHPSNILLIRANGEVRPKLADSGFQKKLHQLSGKHSKSTLAMAKSVYWIPNEIAGQEGHSQLTTKTDIWDFGICMLKMLFGPNVIQKYASPTALSDALALSDSLHDLLIGKIFRADPKKRPRAFDLRSSEFLATDAPILEDPSTDTFRLESLKSPLTTKRTRRESATISGPWSRYEEDFVEEGRLGKGGFGEVVKARKKLDGMIYAVKKITQKSSAFLDEILKEVQLLSQLSHPYVVSKYS